MCGRITDCCMIGLSLAQPKWLAVAVASALAFLSASPAIFHYCCRRKSNFHVSIEEAMERIRGLEGQLKSALEKCAAERQGRIRAQQSLREALSRTSCDTPGSCLYPMAPIGVVHSCFSTRNGTPRQALLVPLARATLKFDSSRVPEASLEGIEGYSHCWIIFIFHLNTDMEKLWRDPSRSGFKAKVRVPRLKGERVGVFATRSPHRLCPIGLTVAKVEARHGHEVLVSDVDLVDGTPILDIKPYLPYCDSVDGAQVPPWVKEDNALAVASITLSEGFSSSLQDCWSRAEGKSGHVSSPEELVGLIKQVLLWDIRSVSQRKRRSSVDEDVYRLVLECFHVWYRIDDNADVVVEKVGLAS